MKVIVIGATGYIGNGVLQECLLDARISSVVALSRRELPDAVAGNPKLKVVIVNDFLEYSDSVLRELEGAVACLWCIGSSFGDPVLERKVNYDYPLATADSFAKRLAKGGQAFRFVHLSGGLAETDPSKSLWFMDHDRKIRGEVQVEFVRRNETHVHPGFEAYVVKPGAVFSSWNWIAPTLMGKKRAIRLDECTAIMIQIALEGHPTTVMECPEMVDEGRKLLQKKGTAK